VSVQHLSDEAVAAFADGVLGGSARERARKHVEECAECRTAVRVQREAALALRAAPPPSLPTDLMSRLRSLPQTTPVSTLPTAIAPDGSTVLATRLMAPMSAFAPVHDPAPKESHRRGKPIVTAVAVAALAGALTAGSVASRADAPTRAGTGQVTGRQQGATGAGDGGAAGGVGVVGIYSVFSAHHP
jgi:Putative zinc-finger